MLLAKTPVGSATWAEEPVVADVDNDGHADIVVSSDFFRQAADDTGIIVFQDVANKWKRTRRIWNQHSYHVTNVNEDATIPVTESAHWLVPGLNSFRTNAFVPGESADETDSFTYVAIGRRARVERRDGAHRDSHAEQRPADHVDARSPRPPAAWSMPTRFGRTIRTRATS